MVILTTGDFSIKFELHNNKYSGDTKSLSAGGIRKPKVKNGEFGVDGNMEEEKEKLVKAAAVFRLFFKVLSEKFRKICGLYNINKITRSSSLIRKYLREHRRGIMVNKHVSLNQLRSCVTTKISLENSADEDIYAESSLTKRRTLPGTTCIFIPERNEKRIQR